MFHSEAIATMGLTAVRRISMAIDQIYMQVVARQLPLPSPKFAIVPAAGWRHRRVHGPGIQAASRSGAAKLNPDAGSVASSEAAAPGRQQALRPPHLESLLVLLCHGQK